MTRDEINEEIVQIIEENGILTGEDGKFYDIDSLKLISCIVALEDKFDIEFPDDFLGVGTFIDVESICQVVGDLVEYRVKTNS